MKTAQLALHGGAPVRAELLPYGRHEIDDDDVAAVARVLRSDWLTGGPTVAEFEAAFARAVGAPEAVAVNSGTAALHAAMFAIGVGPGDEVVVPPMTFAASANAIVYQGGTPVFVDVDARTLLVDPAKVAERLTERTKAIVAVDYAGQPCDYDALRRVLAGRPEIKIVADACHALGARDGSRPVGTLADLNAFSLHPVKHVTTGEGGVVTTADPALAARMRMFRNHGITVDHRQRGARSSWIYEIVELGYNYRLTDVQSALGLSQLGKLAARVARRQAIAETYIRAFASIPEVQPLAVRPGATHAYHLFVVRVDTTRLSTDRATLFAALRREGIGVNVHYIPVHFHPFYRRRFGFGPGLCPIAEAAYEQILTLPMFPAMTARDIRDVVDATAKVIEAFRSEPPGGRGHRSEPPGGRGPRSEQ
ncbi:MAG: UDP-4-amino-4,6-dideoxy-N-acetyl-beta-L-altrosamine transaminase [Acidobacteria bacterium]|nr:UDP-4-amino-4,6-dideoxy-N-acetyl-beta-L-altrosamine transaminase [Acidobacteriota bacterium]